jgi:hypothetical protein
MAEDNDLNDPEDAYDVSDAIRVKVLNFVHRLEYVIDRLDRPDVEARLVRLREDLEEVFARVAEARDRL